MRQDKLVMIPGPTPVPRSIQNAMGRPIAAFGDPAFVKDFKGVIDDLNTMWNNPKGQCFVVAASGSLAMEMAIVNTVEAGDSILIASNGFFGDRFINICNKKGLDVDVLEVPWGETVTAELIKEKLDKKEYAALTVTHVDTSTGARAPIESIGHMMGEFPETIYIVDGVCSSAGEEENIEKMNIDVLFTGSQKAFGVCPGLMVLWANEKALKRRESLGEIREYYADYYKWLPVMEDPSKYFATPAINLVWALEESIRLIEEEGLENRWNRHKVNARAVQKALESIGFKVLANEKNRAHTMSVFEYPKGVDDASFRNALYEKDIVVAGALGDYAGKAFRIGHMGYSTRDDFVTTISAIEKTLEEMNLLKHDLGHGVGVFLENL